MNFSISCEALLKPLLFISGVVERRQSMVILSNILLSIEGNRLALVGTDSEVELIGYAELASNTENFEITVPGRKLVDICRNLPGQAMLNFSMKDDNKLILKSGHGRFLLTTLPAVEFPMVEDYDYDIQLTLPAQQLFCLLNQTHFAMAQQDVRYFLNGALLSIEGSKMTVAATDGHRLALASSDLSEPQADVRKIIPRKAILELMKLLSHTEGNIQVRIDNNNICVNSDEFTLTSKLVEGAYPDYHKVVPKHGDKFVYLDKTEFKQALNRVSVLSNEKFRGVRMNIMPNQLEMIANNPEHEEAEEYLSIDYDGEELTLSVNGSYLLDAINALDDGELKLTFADEETSVLVEHREKNQESLYVVMPMRI